MIGDNTKCFTKYSQNMIYSKYEVMTKRNVKSLVKYIQNITTHSHTLCTNSSTPNICRSTSYRWKEFQSYIHKYESIDINDQHHEYLAWKH